VRRRHQGLVEETPSPVLDDASRKRMADAAVALIRSIKHADAGTVEFICEPAGRQFRFIKTNTRMQAERPVTAMVTGCDLVREQFRVAADEPPSSRSTFANGRSSIEFREDAERNFEPSPGVIKRWRSPSRHHIRIVSGPDRPSAVQAAKSALARFRVGAIATTVPFHAQPVARDAH